MQTPSRLLSIAAAALLAACTANTTPAVTGSESPFATGDARTQTSARARLAIFIPRRRPHKAKYVSPATQSIAITIVGNGKSLQFNRGLTPEDPACEAIATGTQCTLPLALPAGTYAGTFVTFNGPLANGSPTGAALSSDANVPLTIKASAATTIGITLYGVPASVTIVPSAGTTALTGNAASGFKLSKCASTLAVDVLGVDASGNYILGPGSPAVALQSSDTAHLAVTQPPAQAPNTFTLTVPTIPNAQSVVKLSLSAIPSTSSGAGGAALTVPVMFDGDICGILSEFTVSHAEPIGIADGPDGALWFTELSTSKIGRMTTSGVLTNEYGTPTASSDPLAIVAGPDDALWFTETATSKIGRISTTGLVTEFPTITAASGPAFITAGPDQNLWFTENGANNVGRITTGGTVSEFPITTANSGAFGIATGPDGNIWYTESTAGKLGSITVAGVVQPEVSIPSGATPTGLVTGPGDNLWFIDSANAAVDEFVPASPPLPMSFSTYSIPASGSNPQFIALGPDRALWLTESAGNAIVRVDLGPPLSIAQYPLPNAGSGPTGIAVGPDGAIWFTEVGGNRIGRLQ